MIATERVRCREDGGCHGFIEARGLLKAAWIIFSSLSNCIVRMSRLFCACQDQGCEGQDFPTWPDSKGFTHSTCLKASNDFPDHYGRGVLKFHSASASIESTLKFFQDDTAVFTTHHCLVTISLDNGFAAFLYEVREGMFLEILTAKWQPLRSLTTEVKIPDWHCALNTV